MFRSVMDLPPITFKRPCLDEPDIEMLCEYALPIIFHQLSRVLFFFLSFTLSIFVLDFVINCFSSFCSNADETNIVGESICCDVVYTM